MTSVRPHGVLEGACLLMLADFPIGITEVFLTGLDRQFFERRSHGIIPAIQVTKQGDDRHYFAHVIVFPVLSKFRANFIGNGVRHQGGSMRKRKGCFFGIRKVRAFGKIPYVIQAIFRRAKSL